MNFVLSKSRFLRIGSFTLFYVAQGLPIGLITIALPAWLAEQGASPVQIANYIAISGLPWAFKLFAGPIMDRFSYLPMGRRRPWVVLAQGGLLFSLVGMAFTPDPGAQIGLLTMMGFIVNSFAAVQDVAVDGMAIDVLPVDERGKANAFMAFGQVVGFSGSGVVSGMALASMGLWGACLILALGVGAIFGWVILVRERAGEKVLPWTEGEAAARSISLQADSWTEIFRNLLRVVFMPASLLLVTMTLCWRIADGFWISAAPVVAVQELGFDTVDYSSWLSITGFVAATLGLLIGPMIDRAGARRFLFVGMAGFALSYTLTGLSQPYWGVSLVPLVILSAVQLTSQVMFVAFIAIHMNVCWEKVAATQFAIYMAWSNLGRSMGAGIYGQISESLTSSQIALVMGGICAIGAAIVLLVNMGLHEKRLQQLNTDEAVSEVNN